MSDPLEVAKIVEDPSRLESEEEIEPRSMRAYREQYWYGRSVLSDYLEIDDFPGVNILEVGPAEAGLLSSSQTGLVSALASRQTSERRE